MNKLIFRNDDVNPSSNFKQIKEIYHIILNKFPNAEIYSCINIFGQKNIIGSVYSKTNISMEKRNFYNVDCIFDFNQLPYLYNIVSHGLLHFNHRLVTYDTQKFSILTSCSLLKTNIFIPPFWEWNDKTEKICTLNGINLWTKENWINIDRETITPNSNYYCFHSWKFTPKTFANKINE
jgi:hypothetical protein